MTKTKLLISLICLFATVARADDLARPIRVSADGHFLVQPDGQPFFWLGDTAWSMFMRLTREETELYLSDRAAKGFNVIQAVAFDGPLDGLEVANRYGELPLIDKDYTRPNPKYFDHIDWVVKRAAHHGLRIAMLPLWGQRIGLHKVFDQRSAEAYGRWIGARYRNQGVIWVLGGDTTPMWGKRSGGPAGPVSVIDDRPVYDAMAAGLIAGDGGDPFITFHPTNLSFSGTAQPRTSLYFHDRAWLDMNMLQSSHFIDPSAHLKLLGADFSWIAAFSYEPIGEEYRAKPVRPIIDGEPRFEDLAIDLSKNAQKGYWSGYDARHAAYQALFAGAAGHTYGNHIVWQFVDPGKKRLYQLPRESVTWQAALQRDSASQLKHAKALLLSRPYLTRIPDQSLIVGDAGEGMAHIGATRDKSGSYAMVYLPQGQQVTVDLNKISGSSALAWWFDPRSGAATPIKCRVATNSAMTFTAPTRGDQSDWVLVIDDESRGFAPPGVLAVAADQPVVHAWSFNRIGDREGSSSTRRRTP